MDKVAAKKAAKEQNKQVKANAQSNAILSSKDVFEVDERSSAAKQIGVKAKAGKAKVKKKPKIN